MTEGHPCFVANNGRLGFGVHEYLSYAPETASPVRLVWLAAHRDRATFTRRCRARLRRRFVRARAGRGDPRPLHGDADRDSASTRPTTCSSRSTPGSGGTSSPSPSPPRSPAAPGLPRRGRRRVPGPAVDPHLLQHQPARTKHYVKTALSVLNMGFMRGLSAAYMEATPAINDWLAGLIERDPVLQATRLLDHPRARGRRLPPPAVRGGHRPRTRRTARCSPRCGGRARSPRLEPGERLATMASLLHVDRDGALVRRAR